MKNTITKTMSRLASENQNEPQQPTRFDEPSAASNNNTTAGSTCPVCGYVNHHAAWCDQRRTRDAGNSASGDVCPVCGAGPDQPGWLRPDVAVNHPDFGRAVHCPACHAEKAARRAERVAAVLKLSQLEGELLECTFQNFAITDTNRDGYEAATAFAAEPAGWLTLHGDHGSGKSHLAAAIANALGPGRALYCNTPDLTSRLRDFDNTERIIEIIGQRPVLILDELDKSSIKNWTREQIQRVFEHRNRNHRRFGLVIVTNESPDSFDEAYIGSRMRDVRYRCVEMTGDYRELTTALRAEARQ